MGAVSVASRQGLTTTCDARVRAASTEFGEGPKFIATEVLLVALTRRLRRSQACEDGIVCFDKFAGKPRHYGPLHTTTDHLHDTS